MGMGQNEELGTNLPGDQTQAVSAMRNTIASRMQQSVSEIPHAWMMIEVDVSNLVALRLRLKDTFMKKEGVPLSISPFVFKPIVNALKEYPHLNSTWDSGSIVIKKDINLSIAVGSEDSVVTPVIHKADHKSIAGLSIELYELVKRARGGKLQLSDMQGGSFTYNNTGAFGSVLSYPIINYPQAAVLTFESIVRKPVIIQEMIAIRSMVNLCLSFDHRILDGMICGRFLQRVKHDLEKYDQDTVIY
jgi:2-oxoisovalerate dehydrogenase E2 component (dihydrolipoyl transacylase)